ncbi:NAD+ synthase [Rhodospirillum rubrum]|uniref:NAD+ synthase n=1 Tax=Rhodospirillum rubrum TaxID=1085 RepID=UPI0019052C5C|nr:NAD+ synthase [Rhodospirillum rubrum]MBK1663997.1 NAD+ synthase [Rhodospirillum rubrum]MBK1675445.1 NAD+ synthase [Rhodospirillum rubrum]
MTRPASSERLTLALCQINPWVGDLSGNLERLRAARAEAARLGAELVLASELALTGYPPEDLVLRDSFMAQAREVVATLAADTADGGPGVIVGVPWRSEAGGRHNAALLLDNGAIAGMVFKHHLPNYGVFDEKRVFDPGPKPAPLIFRGWRLGVMICEDMWFPDVAAALVTGGAEILLVPNGSPFDLEKTEARLDHARARVSESGLPLVYVNQVCGQDELVFDGASFVMGGDGALRMTVAPWREAVSPVVFTRKDGRVDTPAQPIPPPPPVAADIYQAMVLGLRDYVTKNGFPGVILGLSGGIDSALSAAVAVDALGAERVWCVMMPSPYTSAESLEDAAACARLLGTRLDTIDIGPAMAAFGGMLEPHFAGRAADITEENLQSRARGLTLMALSNKFGPMVLSTGNKSEMSVGYATLYGDMCGGYSVLKDVYKTAVFAVSRWRNASRPEGALGPDGPVMPERVITKAPSAELRPDQKDEDSLPPYVDLDRVLHLLIEEQRGIAAATAESGLPRPLVERVWTLLQRAEYKRRQAPPGVKISALAFGRDRRYPITHAYGG